MLLIIDIGNTNIKFAFCLSKKILQVWRLTTKINYTVDEYFVILDSLLKNSNIKISDIKYIVISSVVPKINTTISEFCEKYLYNKPIFIKEHKLQKLNIIIDFPNKIVGTDRLADVVAAKDLYPQKNIITIGMGTATTFNLLSKDGHYYGQIIAPGVSSFANSLRTSTTLLPEISINKKTKIIGNSTPKAIESGIFWGYHSMVKGLIDSITKEERKEFYVIATGGASKLFNNKEKFIHEIDEYLTIKGLMLIFNYMIHNN